MILFTRVVAQSFRALFARCVAGRPRGPAPAVVIQVRDGTRTVVSTTSEGVTLTHTTSVPKEPDNLIVLPASVLEEVEGGTDEEVELDRETKLRGVVRWHGGSKPRTLPVELLLPGKQHDLPELPSLTGVSEKLLLALHECGRTAAKENGRFALYRVQIQGKSGRVVGTDGKVALVWKGVTFPFPDDVLVPALPVFGTKPLTKMEDVKLGRSGAHMVVMAGPWAVWMPTDTTAKYPDVANVIPRHAPTTVVIDAEDVSVLLRALPGLPGSDHEQRPVTLDADAVVRVRGHVEGNKSDANTEVTLARSMSAGPALRVALDRRVLARALTLGCRTWKLTPDKAVVAEGGDVTLVAAPLGPDLAAAPVPRSAPKPAPDSEPPTPTNERSPTVKPEANGHAPPRGDPNDPLEAAEELRAALADATNKATRLVAVLRQTRKEKKALANVLTSLKQLNLSSDGGIR